MLYRFLFKYLGQEDEIQALLGTQLQPGAIFTVLKSNDVWKRETLSIKFKSLVKRRWEITDEIVQKLAGESFMRTIFGYPEDYAQYLFNLMAEHNSRVWQLNALTKEDKIKADALNSMTILTRLRYREKSRNLNLSLGKHYPEMCALIHPMIIKVPIISLQYYLDVHSAFLFNSIRKCNHPHANDLISYLYDLLFLQQKIAISLHEYLRLIHITESQKGEALFVTAEINAIMSADNIFSYLKAAIEKMIVVFGLTFGITGLEAKKTHKQKINALSASLPKEITQLYYCQFFLQLIESENLEELNSYRLGLLHKKGISDLQPHNYVGEQADSIPLKKIYTILHEQHTNNTAGFIAILALLTDAMVHADPPSESDYKIAFNVNERFEEILLKEKKA